MSKIERALIDEYIEAWNKSHPDKKQKTRASVAIDTGINYHTICRLNGGEIGKSVQSISRIADNLGVTVDALLKKEEL